MSEEEWLRAEPTLVDELPRLRLILEALGNRFGGPHDAVLLRCFYTDDFPYDPQAVAKSLHADGRLNEFQVTTFAEQGKFDETNAGLAALAGVAVETAETMMIESRTEGVMILAKVAGTAADMAGIRVHNCDLGCF